MALTYSQWIWGFEVFDASAGAAQNNMIDLRRTIADWVASHVYSVNDRIVPSGVNSSSKQFWRCTAAGTSGGTQPVWPLNPAAGASISDGTAAWTFLNVAVVAGVYTPDELAAAVATALNAADGANSYTCSFSYTTLLFTIGGTSAFDLKWLSGVNHLVNMSGLLGFNNGVDTNSVTSVNSTSALGGTYSTAASLWTAAEPLVFTSPVTAQAAGTAALLTQRAMNTRQHVSDGATVESVYIATLKKVQIAFRTLLVSEQAKMESFLDWTVRGKRFTWQPDKTSANVMKLVLANPGQVNASFEWLTRSETGYGTLTFFEQLS